MGGTTAVAIDPSGNVTFTDEPGSAVPTTVTVPFGLLVGVMVGAVGGVVSVTLLLAAGDAFPAASLATAETGPEPCGVADVAE